MTSIIGAMVITCACGAWGFGYARIKKEEAELAEGFCGLFKHLLLHLPSLAVMEDIMQTFRHPALEDKGIGELLRKTSAGPCNKRYLAAIELVKDDEELFAVLSEAGWDFGSTEYRLQEASFTLAAQKLQLLSEKRRQSFATGEKCYRWLGVLLGAALSILML